MVLIVQFAVGFVVRAVFAAAARARLVAIASEMGAATTGFAANARLALASGALGDALYDLMLDLRPDMRDRDNWSREAAERMAAEIIDVARTSYLRGPGPKRLERRSGGSADRLTLVQHPETVSAGSPDPWMLWFETRDDTQRWRERAWLQPAIDDVLLHAQDAWVESWREQAFG